MTSSKRLLLAALAATSVSLSCFAAPFPGSIVTVSSTNPNSTNVNQYPTREEVLLKGTGFDPNVTVYYTVSAPGGTSLFPGQGYRTVKAGSDGSFLVALAPFNKTSNADGVYQAKAGGAANSLTKGDNFTVLSDITTTPPVVTPADTIAPVIAANNITLGADAACNATVFFNATATDNVDGAVVVTYSYQGAPIASGTIFGAGVYTITAHAKDAAQNAAAKDFTVTVVDNTAPTIGGNITVNTAPGSCSAAVSFVGAADNCGLASVLAAPASGSTFSKGSTVVSVTATDFAGNTTSGTFTVTVIDNEAPVVAALPTSNPSNKNVPTAGANPKSGQNPDGFYALTATDNCGSTAVAIYVKDAGSQYVAGPFKSTDKIKLIQAPGVTPNTKAMNGYYQLQFKGDAQVCGVDGSNNTSAPVAMNVAPVLK